MTKLTWDPRNRTYETGVDRGILYPLDGNPVPWNGLISVDESFEGGELTTGVEDGITYVQHASARDYKATVRAFSTPREFGVCVGDIEVKPGFTVTRQPRQMFSFSYRTMIGETDYKIHIVYNALASPTSRSYASTNDSTNPTDLEWSITATPLFIGSGYRPTAHYSIDSTKVSAFALRMLEDQLYGSDITDPTLPKPEDLVAYLNAIEPPPDDGGGGGGEPILDVIGDTILDVFLGYTPSPHEDIVGEPILEQL